MISNIFRNLKSIPGWKTKRKIVVIESDDWGGIRTPNILAYHRCKTNGLDLDTEDANRYSINDCLESKCDLNSLAATLLRFKDKNDVHPVITTMTNVANPDFEKIRENHFREYFYEPFTDTLKRYYPTEDVFSAWMSNISMGVFRPQYHGREHLNIPVWMRALQQGDRDAHFAFREGLWSYNNHHPFNVYYQAAYELDEPDDLKLHADILADGLVVFERIFGFKASVFVPPNGHFNNSLEPLIARHGIRGVATSKIQRETLGYGRRRRVFHYTGQRNSSGQIYLTRNCIFEPSIIGQNWVESCMLDVQRAFRWLNPAIIGTHRVNYVGSISPANRDSGNMQLESLLKAIIGAWPEVEFMSSDQLVEVITGDV